MGLLRVLACTAVLSVAAGCSTLRVTDIQSGDTWPDSAMEFGATNASTAAIHPPIREAWVYNANAAFGPGPALVLDEFVIVANRKGEVHAIDRESGRRLGFERVGDVINGSPVLMDGVLFTPLDFGSSRALSAWDLRTGTTKWTLRNGARVAASLTTTNDRLVVADRSSRLRLLNPDDGSVVWNVATDTTATYLLSPVVDNKGGIIVVSNEGRIWRFAAQDGRVTWTTKIDEPVATQPAVQGDRLIIAGTYGGIHAVDSETGTVEWSTGVTAGPLRRTSPAVDDGLVVASGTDGSVLALDAATGRERWSVAVGSAVGAAPFLSRSFVFVGTLDSRLVALERDTGALVWETELRGRVKSAMVARDDDLFVLTEPRYVYRFTVDDGEHKLSGSM